MNICVILPSEDATRQAGVRIRYQRIQASLSALGHRLRLAVLQDICDLDEFTDDIYLFSKCYDARAILVARRLAGTSRIVGIDLFDDYFSQARDSRILRFRTWLRAIVEVVDFVLCSTPAMNELAKTVAPHLATHVMNDPAPTIDIDKLGANLRSKVDRARTRREIEVCWFGMGDNAHFSVGLSDLVAFGSELAMFRRHGFNVALEIQTNARALSTETLGRLQRLPVPYTIAEWTEDGEAELLSNSLVCFIPVNAQNFSIAKSLNRAVTALSNGAQVLSTGYPLYKALSPLVYGDVRDLAKDVDDGNLLLRQETIGVLCDTILKYADRDREAENLAAFLLGLHKRSQSGGSCVDPGLAVIHGVRASKDVEVFARDFGVLSIASPFCNNQWEFDLVFRFGDDGARLELYLSNRVWPRLRPEIITALSVSRTLGQRVYRSLDLVALEDAGLTCGIALGTYSGPIGLVASYSSVMERVEAVTELLFPGIKCVLSERSVFPVSAEKRVTYDAGAESYV